MGGAASGGATPASGAARQVPVPRAPAPTHEGNAAGHSVLAAQTWRFPRVPHIDCIWHVCPPPWQHTRPAEQSAVVPQIRVVPLGHAVPVWHVLELPASAADVQHACPIAQSVAAAQACRLPAGQAVPVWHAFTPAVVPAQHTCPLPQSIVPAHEGGARQMPKPYVPTVCVWHVSPIGQSAFVAHVWRAPAGQAAIHWVMFVEPAPAAPPR